MYTYIHIYVVKKIIPLYFIVIFEVAYIDKDSGECVTGASASYAGFRLHFLQLSHLKPHFFHKYCTFGIKTSCTVISSLNY